MRASGKDLGHLYHKRGLYQSQSRIHRCIRHQRCFRLFDPTIATLSNISLEDNKDEEDRCDGNFCRGSFVRPHLTYLEIAMIKLTESI